MNIAIKVQGLGHRYSRRPVLEDLTFQVGVGEFFIIIGPNGSGKTTLMKLLATIESLRRGHIDVFGRPLKRYGRKPLAKTIAFVPQLVLEELPFTVSEVVLLGRAPHLGTLGIEGDADRRLADDAMTFTGVNHLAHRKIDRLSGGERQRVFIARAICQQSQIMLLDEPTTSLDLAHQLRIMDLLESLRAEKGITVVMVSHDLNLAAMYGSQLLLLKEGRAVKIGPPADVLTYQTLEEAYGCTLLVDESPLAKMPRVTLVPEKYNIV